MVKGSRKAIGFKYEAWGIVHCPFDELIFPKNIY